MIRKRCYPLAMMCLLGILISTVHGAADSAEKLRNTLDRLDIKKDICVMLGMPREALRTSVSDFVLERDLTVFFQSPDITETTALRNAAYHETKLPHLRQCDSGRHRVPEGKLE